MPINLKVAEELLAAVDQLAADLGMNRTTFVTNLLTAAVKGEFVLGDPRHRFKERFFALPEDKVAEAHAVLERIFGPQPKSGCWLIAGEDPQKYPAIRVGDTTYRAHRLSYMLFRQPIPDGWAICHLCDVPGCISPEHLRLGTARDNAMDRGRKINCPPYLRPNDPTGWPWPPSIRMGPDPFPGTTNRLRATLNKYGERDVLAQLALERRAFPAMHKEQQ